MADDEEDEDADSELRHLREARLREMKSRNASKQELIGKGHGQFREIVQDEFLKEVTGNFFANPFVAAERGFIDEVIMPRSTRRRIARALRMLRNKKLDNPWKKHDNIPL